jgi:hypothetical protein
MTRIPATSSKRIIFRLSEAEYQAYLQLVQRLATTRSRLIRGMIREALGLGPDLLTQDMKTLGEGVYQLGALGRNLNQELRAMHSGKLQSQSADIALTEQVREQVVRLEKSWIETVKRSSKRWVGHDRA